jgi:hypothetical protein
LAKGKDLFISLIVFVGPEALFFIFILLYAPPQRTAHSDVPSQMATHLRTGSILKMAVFEPGIAGLHTV